MLAKAKARAGAKGWTFDLDRDWIEEKFLGQEGRCALSGRAMVYEKINHRWPWAPSIDRINGDEGYTKSNCRLVCAIVNLALLDWGEDAFAEMCRLVAKANATFDRGPAPMTPARKSAERELGYTERHGAIVNVATGETT